MCRKVQILFISAVALLACVCVKAGTNEEGLKFLEENKGKPGVSTLESGLQYKILKEGTGKHHPAIDSPCSCHYEGKLLDGTVFDSSYERGEPTTFAPNQVIKGWTEAMQLMVEGDKWELYIPSELAYGDRGSPPKIPPGSVLIFTMEILDISGSKDDLPPALKCKVTTLESCNDKEKSYIEKIKGWKQLKINSELDRLMELLAQPKNIKPDLLEWIRRRVQILKQVTKEFVDEEEEL